MVKRLLMFVFMASCLGAQFSTWAAHKAVAKKSVAHARVQKSKARKLCAKIASKKAAKKKVRHQLNKHVRKRVAVVGLGEIYQNLVATEKALVKLLSLERQYNPRAQEVKNIEAFLKKLRKEKAPFERVTH